MQCRFKRFKGAEAHFTALSSSAGTSINSETPSGFSDSGASGPPGFAATATIGHPENLKERKTFTLDHRSLVSVSYTAKAKQLSQNLIHLFFPLSK